MKKMDIENLLQWAIREELPKAQSKAANPAGLVSQFGRLADLGVRIDVSRRAFDLVDREPHPDALAVAEAMRQLEPLVLTAQECATLLTDYVALDTFDQLGEAAGLRRFGPTANAMAGVERRAMTHLIVCAHNRETMAYLREWWPHEAPRPQQYVHHSAPDRTGRRPGAVMYGRDPHTGEPIQLDRSALRKARKQDLMPRSLLSWHGPSVPELLDARVDYVVWHRALTTLVARLSVPGVLSDHEVTGPAAPAEPWRLPDAGELDLKAA